MSPKKRPLHAASPAYATARRHVAQKYLEVAELVEQEDGAMINVCVGLCVLAGIASSDAISVSATGTHYSGKNHSDAADYLSTIHKESGKRMRRLISLKPPSHYGSRLLTETDRVSALRDARFLVNEATQRTV